MSTLCWQCSLLRCVVKNSIFSRSQIVRTLSNSSKPTDNNGQNTTLSTTVQTYAVIEAKPLTSGSVGSKSEKSATTTIEQSSIGKEKIKRRRMAADREERYTANVFVTPERAYNDYLVTTTDLAGLWNTRRRSPWGDRPDIIVYLRVDVEKRAVEIWGSLAKLEREKARRRELLGESATGDLSLALLTAMRGDSNYQAGSELKDKIMEEQRDIKKHLGSRLRWLRGSRSCDPDPPSQHQDSMDIAQKRQLKGSGRVVWAAIAVNAANFAMKLAAYLHTGSSAMFAESVHSLADTANQAILAFGIYQSKRSPDQIHPYGWYNFSYVSSLISGVGIFFVGAGLSWYHGIQALLHPDELESINWALAVLAGSFITEGASLLVGVRQIRREAIEANLSFR